MSRQRRARVRCRAGVRLPAVRWPEPLCRAGPLGGPA